MEKFREFEDRLHQLSRPKAGQKSDDCPDERKWLDVAAHILPEVETLKYLEHAATCDNCGSRLKTAIAIFAPEITEEEQRFIDSLRPPLRPRQPAWNFAKWGAVAAGLLIVTVVSLESYRYSEIRELNARVKDAFRGGRPSKYRVSGFSYSGILETRGRENEQSRIPVDEKLNVPLPEAQAYLLNHDPANAVRILEKARTGGDNSAAILNSLAVACAMEADRTGEEKYRDRALGITDTILAAHPDDSAALFNRALIFESRNQLIDAATTLRKALQSEHDPAWRHAIDEKLQSLQ